jgi:D-beta-D-heptose 7-phosphate kinase/D-beta-D-heptose 1-phosphate adenosyltransferase
MKQKILTEDELKKTVNRLKAEGKKVVSTSGCFDILHAGHVAYLEAAKEKGDVLVLFLNSDSSVRGLKGPTRPIVSEDDRAAVIAGLEAVDYVTIFSDATPVRIIRHIQPDVFVKGGDYEGKHIPEMDAVAEYGGSVEYVLMVPGHSSTNIIEKIKNTLLEEKAK